MLTGSLSLSLLLLISLSLHKQVKNYSVDLFNFGEGEVESNIKDEFIELLPPTPTPEFYSHHPSALSPGTTQVVLSILSLSTIDRSMPNMDTLQNHRSQQSLINAPDILCLQIMNLILKVSTTSRVEIPAPYPSATTV